MPLRPRRPNLMQYLLAVSIMAAGLGLSAVLFVRYSTILFTAASALAVITAAVYVLGSTLCARPLRKPCPVCGSDALRKLSDGREIGIRCEACAYVDEQGEPDYYGELRAAGTDQTEVL